jgi:quercetin dioxygenase-like cupin family protein
MKAARNKLAPGKLKLNSKEKYTRLFSVKNGSALSLNSGYVILGKGKDVGEHDTNMREEVIIILEGKGELLLRKKKIIFEKGSVLYVPPDTMHNVKNTGAKDLKYVFVTA